MGAMEGMGSHCSGHHPSLCSSDLKPQKSSIPDWAIVLITLTLVAAIVGLMYGVKMACQLRREMHVGCGCGSVTPYSCHLEAGGQRHFVK
ncbi:uncharacterized protein LOC131481837 [Ochotona princeps]|uniref:uncharacterized protein LOC131481837 n=1 Tax=Ochotona princeps TaxID=9978 RepID=UPI0027148ECF|nr:uncharacterized protein LOC131481837 [Ochotona princeps]